MVGASDGTEKLPTGPLHGDQTAKTLSGVGGQRDEKKCWKSKHILYGSQQVDTGCLGRLGALDQCI